MIPTWTPRPVTTPFIPPYDEPYDPKVEIVLGGRDISDASDGRASQRWTAAIDGSEILIANEAGVVRHRVPAPGAQVCSLAFDSNMGVVAAWQTASGSFIYFFDSLTGAYITQSVVGTTSNKVGVDDNRTFATGQSDVLWFYTRGGQLFSRVQRERYATERLVGPSGASIITRAGPSAGLRFQVRLEKPKD